MLYSGFFFLQWGNWLTTNYRHVVMNNLARRATFDQIFSSSIITFDAILKLATEISGWFPITVVGRAQLILVIYSDHLIYIECNLICVIWITKILFLIHRRYVLYVWFNIQYPYVYIIECRFYLAFRILFHIYYFMHI